MHRKNLLSLFADFARVGGDVAVIQRRGYRREKLTYKELYASARCWRQALAAQGVVPGDRVLLWGPNSAEWVACFWGILLRGAVVVPMDSAASPDFVQRAIKDAGAKLILRDRQQRELPGAPPSMIIHDFEDVVDSPAPAADACVDPGEASTRTIKQERATALIAVPRMLDLLHAGIEREFEGQGKSQWLHGTFENARGRRFLKRAWMFRRIHRRFGWKFWAFISGGAALSNETEDFFKRMGYAVVQGYGMTETASLISLNHPFRSTEGSVGKILPGREFKLAEDGEILVRGENVSSGYWEKGSVRPADQDGWLRTGDLGELDGEGNLRFRGRKKNVIVTSPGLNVYPESLEAPLRKQPAVHDCVATPP